MEKFLFLRNTTSDALLIPLRSVYGFEVNYNSTAVLITIDDPKSLNANDQITINTIEDKAGEVIDSITLAIAENSDPFILIGDDVDNQYINSNITGVGSISI